MDRFKENVQVVINAVNAMANGQVIKDDIIKDINCNTLQIMQYFPNGSLSSFFKEDVQYVIGKIRTAQEEVTFRLEYNSKDDKVSYTLLTDKPTCDDVTICAVAWKVKLKATFEKYGFAFFPFGLNELL